MCVGLGVLPGALTCGYAVDTNLRLEAIYQSKGAVGRKWTKRQVCGLFTLGNMFLGNLLTDPWQGSPHRETYAMSLTVKGSIKWK